MTEGELQNRPNSSQQPTRGRSLARRFRASFCATLRVALPDREGRVRLSERTLGRRSRSSADKNPQLVDHLSEVRDIPSGSSLRLDIFHVAKAGLEPQELVNLYGGWLVKE